MSGIAAAVALWSAGTVSAGSIRQMQGERRVLIWAAPAEHDARLTAQRHYVAGWTRGAADRDVTLVEIAGDSVTGAEDSAQDVRRRYDLPADRFAVVLIGKDGHIAYRADQPVTAKTLQATIDAMPMRRAGQR